MSIAFIIRRILIIIPTIFCIMTASFFLMRFTPGGPFSDERVLSQQAELNLKERYNLNKPLHEQYFNYLGNILLHGDLGPSLKYQDWSVNQLVYQGFSTSFTIGACALIFSFIFGVGFAILAALFPNSLLDFSIRSLSTLGLAVPNFVIAPCLSLIFAVTLNWLPAGARDHSFKSYILPIIALSIPQIAILSRMLRASLEEVLQRPYIRTATAKGLSPLVISLKHALPEASLPILSYLGPTAANILTGSLVIEQIFCLPGLGNYLIKGALNRDYTLVLGCVLIVGFAVIFFNFIVDIIYCSINKKIKY